MKRITIIYIICFLLPKLIIAQPPPSWTSGLIIYEIATKSFTSPNGPESGTFNSLIEKVPYLKSLGITGIWLSGHSLSDSKHFYNVWTQYACIDPFKIDPSLGTEEDFKALVNEFHENGIKVFLDVITHGVMNSSPLIQEHPEWFKGGTWGMTDYNWSSNNPELDVWWIDGWVETVKKYEVDGFRLDVNIYRPDSWAKIRRRCYGLNHPVVIFPENNIKVSGTDFSQMYMRVTHKLPHDTIKNYTTATTDMATFIHLKYNQDDAKDFYGTIQLSCHDEGWQGYPLDQNPYVAQGSRWLMGYATLFSPGIPVFMAGEEWNCNYRPLPHHSPRLFGAEKPGKGRWLYASWIDWSKINQSNHYSMLEDVKKMIAIRKKYSNILAAEPISIVPNIRNLPFSGDQSLPKPYIRWNSQKAIIVAANPFEIPKTLEMKLMINDLGWDCKKIKVSDLWYEKPIEFIDVSGLENIIIPTEIKEDNTPKGGISVLLLEKTESN